MKCLKVKHLYAEMLINGVKDWELRTRNTNIRGFIGIGDTKTKKVIGYAKLVNSFPVNIPSLYNSEIAKHHQALEFLEDYTEGKEFLYAWVFESPMRDPAPYPYSFSTGSWCFTTVQGSTVSRTQKPKFVPDEGLEKTLFEPSSVGGKT